MVKDKHTLRAIREGYLGRAVYKIQEINNRFKIIKDNDKVLDLGCYPGSWVQYLFRLNCDIYGIDVKEVKGLNFKFIQKDVYDDSIFDDIGNNFDVVISDLAPKLSGIKELDNERSYSLCYKSFNIAKKVLKPKGNFLVKTFDNPRLKEFIKKLEKEFDYVKIFKPQVSKKRSSEIYVIAKSKHSL